jgi:hypothetical protein
MNNMLWNPALDDDPGYAPQAERPSRPPAPARPRETAAPQSWDELEQLLADSGWVEVPTW